MGSASSMLRLFKEKQPVQIKPVDILVKSASSSVGGFLGKEKEACKQVFTTEGTMATVLHAAAIKLFDIDLYEWEPETIELELIDELRINSLQLPETNVNKLHALIGAIKSENFYKDWPSYIQICSALVGEDSMEELADITVEELAWGVIEVALNDDDFSKLSFSPDVCALTGIVLDENGYVSPPPQLSFAKMPYRYRGSTPGPETDRTYRNSKLSEASLTEFLRDQIIVLHKQIKFLPWIDEGSLKLSTYEASKILESLKS